MENMAARGEGLAGALDLLEKCRPSHFDFSGALVHHEKPSGNELSFDPSCPKCVIPKAITLIRAALEAAAPAGTAARTSGCTASDDCIHECPVSEPESRLDEFKTTVIALWDPELTPEQKKAYIASRGKELREAAALATPSPQAPVDILAELDHEKYTGPAGKLLGMKPANRSLAEKAQDDSLGSPRKVGEDGAQTFEQWWQAEGVHMVRTTHRTGYELMKEAWNAARSSSVPVGEQKQEEGV